MGKEENSISTSCSACPKNCGANRFFDIKKDKGGGFCGESAVLRLSSASLHFGEEPLITVHGGSGTIFVTGCNLRCSFCQNYQISREGMGAEVPIEDFVKICLLLQQKGAENINIVTGSHHIPLIAEYLKEAKKQGLSIPVAWNSSAYESVGMLKMLEGLVDIWLPDLKTLNPLASKALFRAEDYPTVATKAIDWMLSTSPLKIKEVKRGNETKEKMLSGVIIRHLFLPARLEDTADALEYLKKTADGKACISLMSQYTPVPKSLKQNIFAERLVSDYLFYQDLSSDTSWLPDFSKRQPFSNALATPVWHWREGYI